MNTTSLGDWLLILAAPRAFREEILGDVHEKFRERETHAGKHLAMREFYANVLTSLPALVAMKIEAYVRVERVRSFLFGFAAFLVVFTTDQTAGILGVYSRAFLYSLIAIVTFSITWNPRMRRREALAVLFAAMVVWTLIYYGMQTADRGILHEPLFYLRFLWLAITMAVATLAASFVRRRLVRPA